MSKNVGQAVIPLSAINGGEFSVDLPPAGVILTAQLVPVNGAFGVILYILADPASLLVTRRFLLLDTGTPTLALEDLAYIASLTLQAPNGELATAHLFELIKTSPKLIIGT